MHKHTFGKDRGLEVLTIILDESPKQQRKRACAFIQKYIRELEQLQHVPDSSVRVWWLQRICRFYKDELKQNTIYNDKLKDFINNALVTWYRNKMREFEHRGFRNENGKWCSADRNVKGENH